MLLSWQESPATILRGNCMESKSPLVATRSLVLRAADAAKAVGLSESTLAKLRLNGNGPVYCKLGRRVVYRSDELDHWLKSRATTDTTDANARFLQALTAAH